MQLSADFLSITSESCTGYNCNRHVIGSISCLITDEVALHAMRPSFTMVHVMAPRRDIADDASKRKILRRRQVLERTGLSYSTIWRYERDGKFPARVVLTDSGLAVGWYDDEVTEFIASRIRSSGKPIPRRQSDPTVHDEAAD